MIEKQQIIEEFETRIFKESYLRIFKCLSLIDDKDLWRSPNSSITSVGCLIQHLNGNVRQWILAGVAKQEDGRIRAQEFIPNPEKSKDALITEMNILENDLRQFFNSRETFDLQKKICVQNFNVTIFSAFIHVIEHYSYHTGQITTLTKLFTNQDTGYYDGFEID